LIGKLLEIQQKYAYYIIIKYTNMLTSAKPGGRRIALIFGGD